MNHLDFNSSSIKLELELELNLIELDFKQLNEIILINSL